MAEGVVFDIKEFAVFDGPGIRTTVFMKGCPLRCMWCHNPEGLSTVPELMVSQAACRHCGACQAVCPHPDACISCGRCIPYCPGGFRKISGTRWQDDALAQRLLKDRDMYHATGGGVTFSGGEPLLQWPFVASVIARLEGVHTAIETSGFSSDAVFRAAMDRCSLILMDWKISDPVLHKRYTGVEQAPIRRHLNMLKEGATPFILRMPIIPGVNDHPAHFEAAARMVAGAKALLRAEFLPYQPAAGAKYAMVGKTYAPDFPQDRPPRFYPEYFAERNIPYQIFK